jgi:predicted solute-binding protein
MTALQKYLRENIDFALSAENQRGLEHFYTRAAALGLIAEAKAIKWAPMWENARAKA